MIFLTVSMYVLLCSAPLVYGIGLKNLVKSPPNVKTVCLSAAKSFVSALCSITVMWLTIGHCVLLMGIPVWLRIVLTAIAVGVTIHILSYKTLKH